MWILVGLAVLVLCAIGYARDQANLRCPHCGRRGTLYNMEPAPGIWSMECDACGGHADRLGNPD
jgi:hypothetical protein